MGKLLASLVIFALVSLGIWIALGTDPVVDQAHGTGPLPPSSDGAPSEKSSEMSVEKEAPSLAVLAGGLEEERRALVTAKETGTSKTEFKGSVQVAVVDREGVLLMRRPFKIRLGFEVDGKLTSKEFWVEGTAESGRIAVPLGATVTAEVVGPGDASCTPVQATAGSGEDAVSTRMLLVLETEVGSHGAGRLVDVEGAPLVDMPFGLQQMRIREDGGRSSNANAIETDEFGYFECRLSYGTTHLGPGDIVSFEFETREDGQVPLFSDLNLWEDSIPNPLYFGDVVMAAVQPLATGRIVDSNGAPVKGAIVEASYLSAGRVRPVNDQHFWTQNFARQACAPSSTDGSFTLYGQTDERNLFAEVIADGYFPMGKVAFGAGVENLQLLVGKAGSIEGSFITPGAYQPYAWSIEIRPEDDARLGAFEPKPSGGSSGTDGSWWMTSLHKNGSFVWGNLEPGFYRLRMRRENDVDPLTEWRNIEVRAGEVTEDPALQGYDLAKELVWAELKVLDSEGAQIEGARSALVQDGEPLSWSAVASKSGGLFLHASSADVAVAAESFITRIVGAVPGENEVRLDRAPTFSIELPPGVQAPGGVTLAVSVWPMGKGARFGSLTKAELKRGKAQLTPGTLGPHTMQLFFKRKGKEQWTKVGMPATASVFEVFTGLDGTRVELPVTQAALDAACALE